MTFILLKVLGALMPLRGPEPDEAIGMDSVHHGDRADRRPTSLQGNRNFDRRCAFANEINAIA